MPIYEYQCNTCGNRLEALQGLNDAPLTDCPECGKPALSKMISAAGFQLKGGGWYQTDYKAKGRKPASTSDEAPPSCGQGACTACSPDA
jgi:putative FmdB family regulatory protein